MRDLTEDLRANRFVLGETGEPIEFSGAADNRGLAAAMAGQARRTIHIYTPDLEAPVYDDSAFVEAVTQLAVRSPATQVRILVGDPGPAVRHGQRLIEVARRFTSSVHIHRPAPEHRDFADAFLLVDETGYIHKHVSKRYEGIANFKDRLRARELLRSFDEVWAKSGEDVELRRLYI